VEPPQCPGQKRGMDVDGVSEPCQWKANADMLSVMLVSIINFVGTLSYVCEHCDVN
jgi:hypothetical protein